MISAIEKRKLVYVLNRDSSGTPTIASPLEAHRSRTITFDTVGLDNGYDNPIFASLEFQYLDYDSLVLGGNVVGGKKEDEEDGMPQMEKQLAYYELDLGLNHVSRRWATTTHRTACCLAAVPGGADGPGGVLIGGEDYIEYVHETMSAPPQSVTSTNPNKKATKIICAIPRRKLHPAHKGVLVTTITVHRQKKSKFFALAQSELGDVYKITLTLDPSDKTVVRGMIVSLLDTLPPGNALNISKSGMLFLPAEFGNHVLYQFERIDLEDAPTCTSEEATAAYLDDESNPKIWEEAKFYASSERASKLACSFTPTMLVYLVLCTRFKIIRKKPWPNERIKRILEPTINTLLCPLPMLHWC
mmetsp:Transcript_11924/g.15921  ORF Transcript_11924/g.15921 Transcript_11924/m.15921 type:complete len:358 (-) Transcript_11924:1399-2472(-)